VDRPSVEGLLSRDRLIVIAAIVGAATVSACFILAGGGTGMSAIDMSIDTGPAGALIAGTPDWIEPVSWSTGYAAVIFVMWWLMMVAMMVPSATPVVLLYGALNRDRGAWGALEFLSGYLAAWAGFSWAGFSVAATAVQGLLSASGLISAMYMNLAATYLAAAVLIGAGLYQLTPMKAACLDYCRSPVEALTHHRRTGRAAAFRMGLVLGGYCLGCCWALMALLFVGGVMNIWWIAGITLYVAVEKLVPGGKRVARLMSAVLIVAGLALLIRSIGVSS
jgi:predicted metal-binding membrane protein